MRTVSSLEIGFSEESMSRSPIDWFAGVRALRCGSVAANARIAPEGMALQLSYHCTAQNVLGLFIWAMHGFSGPCQLGAGSRPTGQSRPRRNIAPDLRTPRGHTAPWPARNFL